MPEEVDASFMDWRGLFGPAGTTDAEEIVSGKSRKCRVVIECK